VPVLSPRVARVVLIGRWRGHNVIPALLLLFVVIFDVLHRLVEVFVLFLGRGPSLLRTGCLLTRMRLVLVLCGIVVSITVAIFLFRCRHVLREAIESEFGNVIRAGSLQGRADDERIIRSVASETEIVHGLLVKLCLVLDLSFLSEEEFVEAERVNRLDLLLKDLGHRIALALQQMDEIHYLFLSQAQICDLVLKRLQKVFKLDVLPDEHVDVLNKLLILLFDFLMLRWGDQGQVRGRGGTLAIWHVCVELHHRLRAEARFLDICRHCLLLLALIHSSSLIGSGMPNLGSMHAALL